MKRIKNTISLEELPALTWSQIVEIMKEFPDRLLKRAIFLRTIKIQNEYDIFIQKLGIENMSDNIKNQIEDLKNYKFSDKSKDLRTGSFNDIDLKFMKNIFPYNISENIEHLIVWTNSDISEVVRIFYLMDLDEFEDYIIFNNVDKIRSIKNINHYHMLVKKNNMEYVFNKLDQLLI